MGLNSKLVISATADLVSSPDGLGVASVPMTKVYSAILTSGIAAGMADKVYHASRTLAPSANESLDLAGVLLDPLGAVLTFVKIKGIVVASAVANANDVVVGNAASNAWAALLGATSTVTLKPGAVFAAFAGQADGAGWAVTAGTGDQLKILNGGAGTSVTYDIIVVGTSA